MSVSRRKAPKGITLGPYQRWDPITRTILRDRDAEKTAEERSYKVATPERVAKAATGQIGSDRVQRLGDAFDWLRSRELLDVKSATNDMLWYAGLKYRRHWHGSGLFGLSAMDLTKDIVDGGSGEGGISFSDSVLHHREKLREANATVGPRCGPFLIGVVCHEKSIKDLHHLVAESKNARSADVLALDRLREALHRLSDLWKMRPHDKGKLKSWHDTSG